MQRKCTSEVLEDVHSTNSISKCYNLEERSEARKDAAPAAADFSPHLASFFMPRGKVLQREFEDGRTDRPTLRERSGSSGSSGRHGIRRPKKR